ncbi:MAG: hypothetical protein GIKADHBN_01151 [Phycisphaerales bacterium]|nr:hypothetical protein [Phycisphaerales bacterium]
MVEGRLAAEHERAVLQRWKNRPEVIAFVEDAIQDRAGLASLPEVAAPVELLDRVEAVLERDSLLGAGTGEQPIEFSTGIEQGTLVSARPPRAPSFSGRRRLSPALRYAGLAAMLVLATVVTFQMVRNSGPGSSSSSIVQGPVEAAGPALTSSAADTPIAMSEPQAEAPGAVALSKSELGAAPDRAESDIQESGTLAMNELAEPAEMTADRALALAREGRLMVRVVTGSVDRAVGRMQTGEDRRLASVVSSVDASPADAERIAVAAEIARPLEFATSPLDGPTDAPSTLIAADRSHLPAVSLRTERPVIERRQARRAVARVDVAPSAEAIDSLKDALGTRGTFVQFVELSDPIPSQPAFRPEQALWWTQPPSTWTPTIGIPVVFEQP